MPSRLSQGLHVDSLSTDRSMPLASQLNSVPCGTTLSSVAQSLAEPSRDREGAKGQGYLIVRKTASLRGAIRINHRLTSTRALVLCHTLNFWLGATGGLPASAGPSTNTGKQATCGARKVSRDAALPTKQRWLCSRVFHVEQDVQQKRLGENDV